MCGAFTMFARAHVLGDTKGHPAHGHVFNVRRAVLRNASEPSCSFLPSLGAVMKHLRRHEVAAKGYSALLISRSSFAYKRSSRLSLFLQEPLTSSRSVSFVDAGSWRPSIHGETQHLASR